MLGESERVRAKRIIEGDLQAIYSHVSQAGNNKEAAELLFFTAINTHGLAQEVTMKQSLLMNSSKLNHSLIQRLRRINSNLDSDALSPQLKMQLALEKEVLEHKIYSELPALKPKIIQTAEIGEKLGKHSAIIEFIKYRAWDRNKPRSERWGAQRFMALLYRKGYLIEVFDIGEVVAVNKAIDKALYVSSNKLTDFSQAFRELENHVFIKLRRPLNAFSEVFIVPDGEMNRLPFAGLSLFQASNQRLRILTSVRELLKQDRLVKASPRKAIVFSDPSFGSSLSAPAQTDGSNLGNPIVDSKKTNYWSLLPGTKIEGQKVAEILKASVFSGDNATVANLKSVNSPSILHIATHGFFSLSTETESTDSMANTGLVFVGVNNSQTGSGSPNGLLTANALSTLNLNSTDLVVLSACDTANGSIESGEGVYGLQRALSIAGAGSTLLSLWKVDDMATAEFMVRFYKRLKAGEGRSDALAAVQKEFRSGSAGDGKWKEPYYWAAWQLVGDWRPIPGL
jgi:hypothetical protein